MESDYINVIHHLASKRCMLDWGDKKNHHIPINTKIYPLFESTQILVKFMIPKGIDITIISTKTPKGETN